MKTIFIDIDGTLLTHNGDLSCQILSDCSVLPGAVEKINDWNRKGYHIIMTTGRKECMRQLTKDQLFKSGLFYDQLIMGLPRGKRILINDSKPDMIDTAEAIVVIRNKGIENIEL